MHRRLGNFILAEDDETLEGVVLELLAGRGGTLAIAETFTGGQAAARITTAITEMMDILMNAVR